MAKVLILDEDAVIELKDGTKISVTGDEVKVMPKRKSCSCARRAYALVVLEMQERFCYRRIAARCCRFIFFGVNTAGITLKTVGMAIAGSIVLAVAKRIASLLSLLGCFGELFTRP